MNTGNSPYETKPNDKNIRYTLDPHRQVDKYKEDEASQKAPKILPHEVSNITMFLGDTFTSLTEIRNILVAAGKNKELSVHVVDSIKEKIDEINKIVLEIPEELDKIGI